MGLFIWLDAAAVVSVAVAFEVGAFAVVASAVVASAVVASAVVIAAAFGAAIVLSRALVFVAAIEASQEPVIAPVRLDVIAASPAGAIGVSTVVADTHVSTIAGVMDRGTGVAMGVIATTIEATGMRFLGGFR